MRLLVVLTLVFFSLTEGAWAQTLSARDAQLRERIEDQLSQTTQTLRKINTSINQTQDKMAELESELARLREEEIRLQDVLSENIQKHHLAMANLARLERQPMRAMLTYDAFKVQPQRQPIMAISRKAMNKRIEENREKLAELLQVTHKKEIHQGQLTAAQERLEAHRTELANLQQKQRKLLSLPPQERRKFEAQTRKVARLGDIEKLLSMSNALSGVQTPEHLAQKADNLPLKGVVTTRFGQLNPKTGIAANGVRIQGVPGQTVKAVRDGRILYAGPFKGFGFLVIMEHADGVHSLYGGMEKTHQDVGSYLSAGNAIGSLPEEDGPQLYLEVREDGEPINPQRWLKNG